MNKVHLYIQKKRNKTKTYNYDKEWHFNQGNIFRWDIYQQ